MALQSKIENLNQSKDVAQSAKLNGETLELMPDASIKSAFTTPDGHYQFKRLSFGLKNALFEFSRVMHQILGQFSFVEIYLDDITIHSKSFTEHVKHVELVLEAI